MSKKGLKQISINSFMVGSKAIRFKEPLILESDSSSGKTWTLSNDELNLMATGKSVAETENKIREQLEMLWEHYAVASDKDLTFVAIKLKNKFKGMVEED